MQRALASTLIASTVLSTSVSLLLSQAGTAVARDFSDTAGTPYRDAFAYLAQEGIVQGYADGSARPYNAINRAEALKVVVSARADLSRRASYFTNHMPPVGLFSDISQSAWFGPHLEAAFEKQVVTGYPDGTFRPGNAVTVEEAIALLLRSYGISGTAGEARVSDRIENRSKQWFTPVINGAIQRNLVGRYDKLRLDTPITRGQFFEIAYRLHSITAEDLTAFRDPAAQVAANTATASTGTAAPRVIQVNQGGGSSINFNVGQPTNQPSVGGPSPSTINHPYASQQFFAVTIPDAGIFDLTITHPDDPFSSAGVLAPLQNGVGHLFGYPGGGGKVMVYGHSSGYPWDTSEYTKIFRQVNQLEAGDRIYLTYDGKLHVYEVTFEETVPAGDTSRFNDAGGGEELILYTCWPPDSIQQRYLVHALPVETVAAR
jgi:LPXTG-site transpeptidase (sortase) family protein